MDKKQKVLTFIRQKGPSIPGWINKEIELDILMTSALLSEMVSEGLLNISSVKMGGSPMYYIKGQESALVNFIDKLHEKEKKAVLLLKEKGVLRDSILEPVIRVALRQTKDFAKPFTVNIQDKKELFWKWFLINDKEIIKKKVYSIIGSELNQKNKNQEKKQTENQQKTQKNPSEQNKAKQENKKKENIILNKKLEEEINKLRITILEKEIIRKDKEFDMIVTLPSAVGKLKYFCKYLNKKRINDKDLSSAYVKGQMKKLPVLVLIAGDLTKKAEELKEEMEGITIKKVGD